MQHLAYSFVLQFAWLRPGALRHIVVAHAQEARSPTLFLAAAVSIVHTPCTEHPVLAHSVAYCALISACANVAGKSNNQICPKQMIDAVNQSKIAQGHEREKVLIHCVMKSVSARYGDLATQSSPPLLRSIMVSYE